MGKMYNFAPVAHNFEAIIHNIIRLSLWLVYHPNIFYLLQLIAPSKQQQQREIDLFDEIFGKFLFFKNTHGYSKNISSWHQKYTTWKSPTQTKSILSSARSIFLSRMELHWLIIVAKEQKIKWRCLLCFVPNKLCAWQFQPASNCTQL